MPVAQGDYVGSAELRVQDDAALVSHHPALAALADGRFVVVWSEPDSAGSETNNLKGRLFDADGAPLGEPFPINATTDADQHSAAVAALGDGGFVVVWTDTSGLGGDSSDWSIKGQRFDSDGAATGGEFLVNNVTGSAQLWPEATGLASGGFVVTWTDSSQVGGDTSLWGIKARIYEADGDAAADEFLVNATTAGAQEEPVVGALPSGGFVILWADRSEAAPDPYDWAIRGRTFAADGTPGDEFVTSLTALGSQYYPDVAVLPSGGFVVTWESDGDDGAEIIARLYDAAGQPLTDEIAVNETLTYDQRRPSVTALADGGFMISWQSEIDEAGSLDAFARLFDADGNPAGSEFRLHDEDPSWAHYQEQTALATLADGTLVAGWAHSSITEMNVRFRLFSPEPHRIEGTAGDDTLIGTDGIDLLEGLAGDDTLNGAGGADEMRGGAGNDIYVVDHEADEAEEAAAGDGRDLVRSSVDFTLGAFVEKLTLTGAEAIDGTGNGLNNFLTGNGAANRLDGGSGADAMAGGAGGDSYVVDNLGDRVSENAGGGVDSVESSVSFSLSLHVENLVLTGTAAIDGLGNRLVNAITGNSAANRIDGGGGGDAMAGGGGDDIYIVDHVADVVTEAAGEGTDLIKSNVSFTLGANVERLTLRGSAAINGTGNDLANTIAGNAAANVLDGGAGADRMLGHGGNDTYRVDDAGDQVIETSSGGGSDTVLSAVSYTLGDHLETLWLMGGATHGTGNSLDNFIFGHGPVDHVIDGGRGNDALVGGAGDDTLHGGLGLDSLEGGAGADQFVFDKALGPGNADMILDFAVGTDTIVLENAVFAGLPAGALHPGAFAIGTAANDANDRIVYDQTTGSLYYDADGNGAAAQVLFATLDTKPSQLSASDFEVI